MKFYAGNTIRLVVLLSLLGGASFAAIQGENGVENSFAEERKRIIETALDRISIELVKSYVTQKGTRFPEQITTIDGLEAYLDRLYPNKNHELRQAELNLRQYKEGVDGYDGTVRDFLKNGLRLYAVNLNGRPLAYDRAKVEAIINEAVDKTNQLKPRSPGDKSDRETGGNKKQVGTFSPAISFIQKNSLITIFILVTANLGTWYWLFVFWMGKKQESRILDRAAGAKRGGQIPLVENRVILEEETEVVDEQKPESVLEAVPTPLAVEKEGEADSLPDNGKHLGQWLVVRTSLPGKLHTESKPPIPCQDSNCYEDIGKGWGIAVVCDGAGSKEYSHFGSKFVTQKAVCYFREIVRQNDWQSSDTLPPQEQWHEAAKRAFATIIDNMEGYAKEQQLDSGSLGCTVIVVIHAPNGVLATHIGDGRAAFCNSRQEWKALIKPHKGEEANVTFFITSVDWREPDKYIESTVFEEKPSAFTLMSDGCESHSFEVNIFDEQEQKYKDPNMPYPKFFQPLVATLISLHQSRAGSEEINAKWERFIESGNEKLKNESDDKTMILGVLVD